MKKIILFLVVMVFAFSFSKFQERMRPARYIEKNMVFVPGGTLHQPGEHSKEIKAFYMFNQEVCNGLYLVYLYDLYKTDRAAFEQALPDTNVWKTMDPCMEPFAKDYLRAPAYSQYPLVGVSYTQAANYCAWLTKWYNAQPKAKFRNAVFRLPVADEWTYAARAGSSKNIYPWEGQFMRNSRGIYLANFLSIDQDNILRDTTSTLKSTFYLVSQSQKSPNQRDNVCVTAPVKSYYPNKYGLYNMAGNVSEYVNDKKISKGGSWHDRSASLANAAEQNILTEATCDRGFRFIMTFK